MNLIWEATSTPLEEQAQEPVPEECLVCQVLAQEVSHAHLQAPSRSLLKKWRLSRDLKVLVSLRTELSRPTSRAIRTRNTQRTSCSTPSATTKTTLCRPQSRHLQDNLLRHCPHKINQHRPSLLKHNQHKPSLLKLNQLRPNQLKPNQLRPNQPKPKQTLLQEETYRWPTTAQLLTKTRTTLVTTTRTMEVTSPTQEPGRVVPVATRLRSQPSSEVRLSVEVLV